MDMRAQWLLFVGPGKTGTSWIDHVLRDADGVRLPAKVKETFFFDRNFRRGANWYFDQFRAPALDEETGKETVQDLRIEVGPTYFFSDDAPERVRDTLPGARVVVTLRDPVQRAISHYLGLRKYGFTDLPMEEALYAFPAIAEHSLYAERLQTWRRIFGDVQVIFYEDVVGHVEKLFREAKLGAAPSRRPAPGRVNGASVPWSKRASRLGQCAADALRRADLHGVIALGKRLGLKTLLFDGGAPPPREDMEAPLQEWLPSFAADHAALTRALGRTPPWGCA